MQKKKWIGDRYVKKGGKRASGFTTVKGYTYYFDPQTGQKKTGWITVNNQRYFLNVRGQLQKGRWLWSGKYYASSTGAVLKGLSAVGKHLYYFDPTTGAKAKNTKIDIGADTYYFRKGRQSRKEQMGENKGKVLLFPKHRENGEKYMGRQVLRWTGRRTHRAGEDNRMVDCQWY